MELLRGGVVHADGRPLRWAVGPALVDTLGHDNLVALLHGAEIEHDGVRYHAWLDFPVVVEDMSRARARAIGLDLNEVTLSDTLREIQRFIR